MSDHRQMPEKNMLWTVLRACQIAKELGDLAYFIGFAIGMRTRKIKLRTAEKYEGVYVVTTVENQQPKDGQ